MTRVSLRRDACGRLCGFDIVGHTGYAEQGKDIVCAGLSLLATACANALESAAGAHPTVRQGDGELHLTLQADDVTHDTQLVLQVLRQGVCDLAEQYPEHIRLMGG